MESPFYARLGNHRTHSMNSKRTTLLVSLMIFIGIGLFFSAQQGILQQWLAKKPNQIIHLSCPNLSSGCNFQIDQQTFSIRSTQPISTNKPVHLVVTGPAESIRLSWQMQGMDMGSNHYKMLSDDQKSWRAQTMLPLCSQQRLDWILTLEVDQAQILIQTQSIARSQ